MILIRRSLFLLLLVCLGCVAESAPPDVARKIEHQMRSYYNVPPEVKMTVGAITANSDMPGYDTVPLTFDGGDGKLKDYKFLLSKDRNTLLRVTKFDLTKDPYAELMSKIDVNGRPTRGAKGAKVVVVNFDDFECPFCSRMHSTLFPEIFKEYGDRVTFIYKDYPAGGYPSLGDPCGGGRWLHRGAEQRCVLGFCRLYSRQQERSRFPESGCAVRHDRQDGDAAGPKAQSRCCEAAGMRQSPERRRRTEHR